MDYCATESMNTQLYPIMWVGLPNRKKETRYKRIYMVGL